MLTPSTWITVMLLAASLQSSAESAQNAKDLDYEVEVCRIRWSFKSPYVRAYGTGSQSALSCENSSGQSHGVPSGEREVHVVYVRIPSNNDEEMEDHIPPKIILNVTTTANEEVMRNLNLVFVLASNHSITWEIVSNCIRKIKHITFWVSSNSRVQPISSPNVKRRRFQVMQDVQLLRQWVINKFNLITIMKESELSRKITCPVGLGVVHGKACNGKGGKETPEETKGCIVPTDHGVNSKHVHIIESSALDEKSSTVVLDIGVKSKVALRRHLLLVLKSHQPTRWIVRTSRLRGTLDIITDQAVDTNGIDMQSVRVVNERLSDLSDMKLVSWTAVNYGAPLSYTSARTANRFELTVDGVDATLQSPHDDDDDDDDVDDGDDGSDRQDNSDGLVKQFLDEIKTSAEQSQSVSCHHGYMEIALRKSMLSNYKLTSDQLTMNDPKCVAQQNDTHFFWKTSRTTCATTQYQHGNKITVKNSIRIRPLQRSPAEQTSDDFSGSGMPLADGWSDGVDETFSDDEDVIRGLSMDIRLDFRCDFPLDTDFPIDIDYYLRIYKDRSFQHEIISFPVVIGENQPLFVLAGTHSDQSLQTVVDGCSLSPVNNPRLLQHPLIINGCVVNRTVLWKDTSSHSGAVSGERFEFLFRKWWNHPTPVYLRCNLTVCNRLTNERTGIPQCQRSTRQCLSSGADKEVLALKPNVAMKTMTAGPFVLHSSPNSSTAGRGSQVHNGVASSGEQQLTTEEDADALCNQVVRVEGLDSPTVIGIAFAAFLIGTLLSATLWYIHSRTGPTKRSLKRRKSAETSGETTPSSTVPITVCQTINQL